MSDPECIVNTEELESSDVKMYPNPARDVLFIEADKKLELIEIYTMDYRKILTMTDTEAHNAQCARCNSDIRVRRCPMLKPVSVNGSGKFNLSSL